MKYLMILLGVGAFLLLINYSNTPHHAVIVGEGIISTGNNLSQAISPLGDRIYFGRMSEDKVWNIYTAQWKEGKWGVPRMASFSSEYTDADPYLTTDGQKLFFLSTRPLTDEGKAPVMPDIWYVNKTDSGWSKPVNVREINTDAFAETFMSLTTAGDIVFASNRRSDRDQYIYTATFEGSSFSTPTPMPINVKVDEYVNPLIARDGSFLIFESDKYEGFGGDDLYIIFKEGEVWSEPINLGPRVNTTLDESAPFVTDDGKHLMFTRLDASGDGFISNLYQIAFQPVLKHARTKTAH